MSRPAKHSWLLLGVLMLCAQAAFGHQPGLSTLAVQIREGDVAVHLTMARADTERLYPLDADKNGAVSAAEFEQSRVPLEELALSTIELFQDGQPIQAVDPVVRLDESDAVHLEFSFPTAGSQKLRLHSAILTKLPGDHRQYFTAYGPRGTLLAAWLLENKNQFVDLPNLAASPPSHQPSGFVQFLKLGVEHIVTGYDHLVFLLGLLIVGGRFVASLKIITAFTVAHSITLALATLELIRVPPTIVEPLIAASIVYVGVENIFGRDLERRWMLAFGFGLIHGCGFATVLRDLGVGGGGAGVAVPLVSFNLGVEAGQLVIASILLPIIWKLNERPTYQPRYVPVGSALIVVAGSYWLVERLIGIFRA